MKGAANALQRQENLHAYTGPIHWEWDKQLCEALGLARANACPCASCMYDPGREQRPGDHRVVPSI
jgi:hypothetical protein